MNVQFRKYHGLGNDYIVIDPSEFDFRPEPEAIRKICDRTRGVGSDGILLGPISGKGIEPWSREKGGVPGLRIFNPDGSEAEKSGNGLRIFSLFMVERGYAGEASFAIATKGGMVSARLVGREPAMVEVDMGVPDFSARTAALKIEGDEFIAKTIVEGGGSFTATFVSMGNPHCVLLVEEPSSDLAKRIGPLVESDAMFPNRTNVQFMKIVDRNTIRIEIWERGAGYTLASGSSSCAAASVAKRLGFVDDEVRVIMPGGSLAIDMKEPSVRMTGPVEKVFEGVFSPSMMREISEVMYDRL
jgi:diaminopimelate epimerase